jgi:hypothetical protein
MCTAKAEIAVITTLKQRGIKEIHANLENIARRCE